MRDNTKDAAHADTAGKTKKGTRDNASGATARVSANEFVPKPCGLCSLPHQDSKLEKVGTSRWPYRYIPRLPTTASTKKYGMVTILQVQKEPDLLRFYQHIMSTSLGEIRCRGVWHIVLGWQFYVHTAVSSESLAEAVGSYLAVTRRHNINSNLSMKHLVWSSKLRAIGLTGFGGEEGVMALALNTHFQCDGPEGWHFIAKRRKHKTQSAAELRHEVRLLSKPKWFQVYLFDLIASRAIKLCKHLPSCWRGVIG